jgi:hypothetical protein
MTALATIPEQQPQGQMVRTDPAAYAGWPIERRMDYARFLSGAADLIPRGLWGQPGPGMPAAPSAAKIFLVLETGAMLDLHPMAAMQGIDVIEGKATISPQLMTTLIRRAGHLFRIKKRGSVTAGDYAVTIQYARAEDPEWISEETWDLQRAVRAQLIELKEERGIYRVIATSGKGNPLPWQLYPESLCVWRAIGVVGRENFDDVLKGIGYMPEELEVLVSPEGVREQPDRAEEDAYIERIKAMDDKADLAEIYREINRAEKWSERIRAEFDAKLAATVKDSRPPKAGAPGNTGEPSLDNPPADVDEAAAAMAGDDEMAQHAAEEAQLHREEQADVATQPVDVIEPEVVPTAEEVAEHDQLVAEGLSEAEAQGTVWPQAEHGPTEAQQLEIDERVAQEEADEAERSRLEFEAWKREQEAGGDA